MSLKEGLKPSIDGITYNCGDAEKENGFVRPLSVFYRVSR